MHASQSLQYLVALTLTPSFSGAGTGIIETVGMLMIDQHATDKRGMTYKELAHELGYSSMLLELEDAH
jgi:hypothetical protein